MTKEKFSSKYNIRSAEKCCKNCHYSIVFHDISKGKNCFQCNNPEIGNSFDVDTFNVCDAWKKRLTKEGEFKEKHCFHEIEKCCKTCIYVTGTEKFPECCNPKCSCREYNMELSSLFNVCDEWKGRI